MTHLEQLAKSKQGQTVLRIVEDLEDRKGLGDEWGQIDNETKREIFETWVHIVTETMR